MGSTTGFRHVGPEDGNGNVIIDTHGDTTTRSSQPHPVTILEGLPPSDVQRIQAHLRLRRFARGEMIVQETEPGEVAYIIRDGFVRVETTNADGTRTLLTILGPGEIVGELSLVDLLGRSASVLAHSHTHVYSIDRATFWEFLRVMPSMTYNLVGLLSRRLRLANGQVQALAALDVEARVARQIQVLATEYGVTNAGGSLTLPFRLTQEELADLVGASRVRVNQVLATFRRDGLITFEPGHPIAIPDLDGLERMWR